MRSSMSGLFSEDSTLERLCPASRNQMLSWIADAWDIIKVNKEMVSRSFQVCGISSSAHLYDADYLGYPTGFLDNTDADEDFEGFTIDDLADAHDESDDDPFK